MVLKKYYNIITIISSNISLFGKVNATTFALLLIYRSNLPLFNNKHTWSISFNNIFSFHEYKIIFVVPPLVAFLATMMTYTPELQNQVNA